VRLGRREDEVKALIREQYGGAIFEKLIPLDEHRAFMLRVANVDRGDVLRRVRPLVEEILLTEPFAIFVVPTGAAELSKPSVGSP